MTALADGLADGMALSLRGAAVRVAGRTVWSEVDLDVAAGEFVAVLGPNGTGKSTLLRAVLGLIPLAEGRARVLGRPPGAARSAVGYLPQRRSFDPSVRIRGTDIVRLGVDGHRWGLPLPGGRRSARAARRVDDLVELVGARGYAHRPIGRLSGGEQQRLLIAQALARDPEMLILDEPLDSLDPRNAAAVAALVKDICVDRTMTVLMVAHDVNPILTSLDRVVYLAGGGAVAGPVAEVITSESLSRLYQTPIEVLRASDGRLVVVGQPEAPAQHTDRHHPDSDGAAAVAAQR
jgi:zinc/manganese transport system ATP-binding protein